MSEATFITGLLSRKGSVVLENQVFSAAKHILDQEKMPGKQTQTLLASTVFAIRANQRNG